MNEEIESLNGITCPYCGTLNANNVRFCVKCNGNLQIGNVPLEQANNGLNQVVSGIQQIEKVEVPNFNYMSYMVGVFLKPFSKYKKEEKKLEFFKNSGILVGIVTLLLIITNVMTHVFSKVRVRSLWSKEISWVWDNVNSIDFLRVIGNNLIAILGLIALITIVYWAGSFFVKKKLSLSKVLGVTATAFIPLALGRVIAIIFDIINNLFGLILSFIFVIYAIVLFFELMNDNLSLDKNKDIKVYFHTASLAIIIVTVGFVLIKILL